MINSLYLQNFKAFAKAEIPLERLTVIVGPNASGKTSILQALQYLSSADSEPPDDFFRGRRDASMLYRRAATGEELQIAGSHAQDWVRIRLVPSKDFERKPSSSIISWSHHRETTIAEKPDRPGWHPFYELPRDFRSIKHAEILRLDASRLSAPANGSPIMQLDGSGLASALTYLKLKQPEDFLRIEQQLHSVVPSFERLRFDRPSYNPSQPGIEETIIFDFKGVPGVPADLASEGTLLVLGMLTIFTGQRRSSLILLDDLDRGLHPTAQEDVVRLLRILLDQDPELQIVATTHSPFLVDCLEPAEVRMTTLGDDGTAYCGSLVDCPEFDKWKDEMMPGEMWSLFGEKWVAKLDKDVEVQ